MHSVSAAVEGCLSHGLRRRALGLFRSSSTTALMHKVAKGYPPAAIISKLILDSDSKEGVKYEVFLSRKRGSNKFSHFICDQKIFVQWR